MRHATAPSNARSLTLLVRLGNSHSFKFEASQFVYVILVVKLLLEILMCHIIRQFYHALKRQGYFCMGTVAQA
jgi:hypothetical protein